jgi:catechol 2,3-dioxygenase-like lactoylglutathione lyase family enzyme
MPTVQGILETALHVADVPRSLQFYTTVLGLRALSSEPAFAACHVAGQQLLLLFQKGSRVHPTTCAGGTIPAHDGSGRLHVAFAIPAAELPAWEDRLRAHSVPIEGRMTWLLGGTSVYFRDPDGHLLELATPGVWPVY